jgi:RNA polymerase sigma-70 factor, ECF subfamily
MTDEFSTGSSSGLSLAVRLANGSAGAWQELVDLYGPLIDSWCRRAGLSDAARADVGQEVFLAVHRGIGHFDASRPGATFRGWLWTITRNAVAQWQRRGEVPGKGGSTGQHFLAELAAPFSECSSIEEPTTTAVETTALLRRALEQIRPTVAATTWTAFWNTTVRGQSAPDVAQQLGLTPAAVRKAKSRMLQRLRQQLGD